MLTPKPRDFTAAKGLTAEQVLKTLRLGIPGTAMKRFEGTLSAEEMDAVAAFVIDEFVHNQAPNTAYHTPANGWPDHHSRYGEAYPFVRGELGLDTEVSSLTERQRQGRTLFLNACITCHEPKAAAASWEAFPLSHMGQVVREPVDHVSRASVYGLHDRPLNLTGLTAQEQWGNKLYDDNCAFCHAKDGTGKNWIGSFLDPHPRNFTDPDQTRHLDEDRLRQVIKEGVEGTSMPAWGAVLSEPETGAILAYLRRAFLDKKD